MMPLQGRGAGSALAGPAEFFKDKSRASSFDEWISDFLGCTQIRTGTLAQQCSRRSTTFTICWLDMQWWATMLLSWRLIPRS
jgi:hypothetical protein